MPERLYHYTDATGYKAIIENSKMDNDGRVTALIYPSKQALSGDAHYGDGWYLTDIPPFGGDRLKIARALWDGSFEKNYAKTEYFLALQVHGNTKITKCRPNVFLIPHGSKYRPTLHSHGPVPRPEKLPYAPRPYIAPQKRETDIVMEQNRETSEHGSLLQRLKRWLGF